MASRFLAVTFALGVIASISAAAGVRHLVLVGGGAMPDTGIARFMEWAGKDQASVLVVGWASYDEKGACDWLRETFAAYKPRQIDSSTVRADIPTHKTEFLAQLHNATAVFFSGGDQNRVMDVLQDQSLLAALRRAYENGVVFGGTSAGTAIMSRVMLTGNGDFEVVDPAAVETREGLGLLPTDIIVDQHFIRRQRQNRLLSTILKNPGVLGVGVDEGMALAVEDNRIAEAFGPTLVTVIEQTGPGRKFTMELLSPGEKYDLVSRRLLAH